MSPLPSCRRLAGFALLLVFSFNPYARAAPGEDRADGGEAPAAAAKPAPASETGQESPATEPAAVIRQEILVTASHPELPPTTAEVAGRELEQGPAEDAAESLRTLPGASSVRRGALNLDPVVRGLEETEVLTTVDGTRTFAAGPARMDSELSHVSPHAIGRLEVVKGPYALTWGAGALGAVAIETIRPAFGPTTPRAAGKAGFRYKDNDSASDGYAGVWGSGESWRYSVTAGQRRGGDYEAGDGGGKVPGDYRSEDSRWSFGYRPAGNFILELSGGYQEQHDIDYPGRILDATYFYARSHALEATWSPAAAGVQEVYGQLYVNRKDHLMNNDAKPTALPQPGRVPPFGIDVYLPTESNTSGGRLRLSGGRGELRWRAGGDLYRLEQNATRTISRRDLGAVLFTDRVWPDASIDDTGLYGQLEWRGRWTAAGTVRVDRVEADAGTPSEFFLTHTQGALAQSETNWSVALSTRRALDDRWSLTLGAGRAVRTASVLERYSDRFPSTKFQTAAEFLGDPALKPERSEQLDLGVSYAASRLQAEIALFHRRMDDYVTVAPDPSLPRRLPLSPPIVYRYVNGDADFYGGEAQVSQQPVPWLDWRASLAWIRGEDKTFDEPAFGMPPLTGRLRVRVSPRPSWWLDLGATAVDRQDRVATARLERETPGYAVFDLGAGVAFGERWRLRAGVENLGDKLYATHLNSLNPFTGERVPERGRSFHGGFEVQF